MKVPERDGHKLTFENRLRALVGVVLFVFGVLTLRLWFLQIVSGDFYRAQAEQNRIKEERIDALRGRIVDRDGRVLATSRLSYAIFVDRKRLRDRTLFERLAPILGTSADELMKKAERSRVTRADTILIAKDLTIEQISRVQEEKERFEGVTVSYMPVRSYPRGSLAAHVLGYVGEISDQELSSPAFKTAFRGDVVGKSGVERSYDAVLRGTKGRLIVEVDALGNITHQLSEEQPVPGNDVVLTIDANLQHVAETAIAKAIELAHRQKFRKANAGAAIVLNAQTGEVLALASYPAYDPNLFVSGIDPDVWRELNSPKSNYPMVNRATVASYPPGSTFKPVTLMAALSRELTHLGETIHCAGTWLGFGKSWPKNCWKRSGHGTVGLVRAIAESCDSVFYELGLRLYRTKKEFLQETARACGFGKKSGLEIGETAGRVPDRAWKKAHFSKKEAQTWLPGDTVNMAIGQGDMLATPLQVALFYGAIANGGKLMKPQIVREVRNPKGKVLSRLEPQVMGHLPASKTTLSLIRRGLVSAVESGTAHSAFAGFSVPVAGKTGTSQVYGKDDFSWFVAYAPANRPTYVVCVLVEQGGHGGSVAAPAARYILSHLFGKPETELVRGSDVSR